MPSHAAPSAPNTISGRNAFLALLQSEGITHLFGNPGTTELPIMHALKDFPDLSYVMAMQESLVVAMADGFSRASGKLVAANVHVAPGLGNAMGALYNAKFTGTPLILTAGQQEQGHGLMEPLLYDDLVAMAAPLVKWAVEVTRLEDLPRIVRRAAKVATTAPTGPVFLSLPGDILNAESGLDLGQPTRIETSVLPTADTLDRLAARILAAARPVIIVGDEVVKSNAYDTIESFAETLGAPVFQQSIAYGAHFRSEHPLFMGALARQQPTTRKQLEPYDLMIALGTDPLRMSVYNPISPLPDELPIVQIGLVDWDIGKNFATDCAVKADVTATVSALLPVLRRTGGAKLTELAETRRSEIVVSNWSAKRVRLTEEIRSRSAITPIDPDVATLALAEAIPSDAIVFDESLTTGRYFNALYPFRDRYGYHALASGGIGWALPAAVGAAFAHPGRRVVAFLGDGSAMYSIQAIWTAAQHKLPVTFVIANNGGYRIIKQRLRAFHGSEHYVGMDFIEPAVDFCALAKSLGADTTRISAASDLLPALSTAMQSKGPHLVDLILDRTV